MTPRTVTLTESVQPGPFVTRDAWQDARDRLAGLEGGGLNMAYEAVDRHVADGRGQQVALRLIARDGTRRAVTYGELARLSDAFAHVLDDLDVAPGERVFVLSGRVLWLYVAVLGALKRGCVVCPLFSAFGPEPIRQRLALGDARVLVTSRGLYEKKVAGIRAELPGLRHVLVMPDDGTTTALAGTVDLGPLLDETDDTPMTITTRPDDPALLHFTSGTTGTPKGALHVHEAVVAHLATARHALDLRPGDVYWCTADPGWVTGTSYGIIAPLTVGVTTVVDEADFDAERWYGILADERVTVWYTAPTAIRMLMRAGREPADARPDRVLRFAASVGEPLNPEAVRWGQAVLGQPFHDNWWQTETGGIMIANDASLVVRPGSMGRPVPGVTAGVLRCDSEGHLEKGDDGRVVEVTEPDVEGMLVLRPGWPSMFRAYLGMDERYRAAFVDGWYVSGDLVRRDDDGYFWFVGRADDVIKTAGHLIGPFEIESALVEHPAVAEAGAYGVPDPTAGALVHAAVSLRPGAEPTEALRRELIAHARRRLGAAVAPRAITFVTDVPKTRSGKIMRRVLRARELGLPEGDTSTMEVTR